MKSAAPRVPRECRKTNVLTQRESAATTATMYGAMIFANGAELNLEKKKMGEAKRRGTFEQRKAQAIKEGRKKKTKTDVQNQHYRDLGRQVIAVGSQLPLDLLRAAAMKSHPTGLGISIGGAENEIERARIRRTLSDSISGTRIQDNERKPGSED